MKYIFITCLIAFLICGCSINKNDEIITNDKEAFKKPKNSGVLRGFSLSPKSFEEEDFLGFFERIENSFDIVTWAGDINELTKSDGGAPSLITEFADTYNYTPVVLAQLFSQETGKLILPLNEGNKGKYVGAVMNYIKKYRPIYFIIGIEVDVLYRKSPDDFEEFVDFYNSLYDEIKKESPNTKVSTTFVLERMKGYNGGLFGGENDTDNTTWFLLDKFKLDFVSFSTYPFIIFNNPSDIPLKYYEEIKQHTDKQIAFTEIGWHSDASIKGWASSEEEQAEFVRQFNTLIKGTSYEFLVWSFMYDLNIPIPFNYTGLISEDGNEKLAYFDWLNGNKKLYKETGKGSLVDEISENADVIFDSIRCVLNEPEFLDENFLIKDNYIKDSDCNKIIYDQDAGLGAKKQLFTLDLESNEVIQITNMDYFFVSGQVVDPKTLVVNAISSDTNEDGTINEKDKNELYLLHLDTKEMECITEGFNLSAINNHDYSSINEKVLFSAQKDGVFHNYLFTLDKENNLVQLTHEDYMDFDSSWSEDGTKIVFGRLPKQKFPLEIPSQIWLMNADGTNQEKITNGGENINNEEPHGPYPIGIDADPDLSPDNSKIAFSRLKTGKENYPFGIYELIIIDVNTKEEEVIDSSYANMLPVWKDKGILFVRQIGVEREADIKTVDPMKIYQGLCLYKDGKTIELEKYPNNVFPVGAYGGSFITVYSR